MDLYSRLVLNPSEALIPKIEFSISILNQYLKNNDMAQCVDQY